MTTSLPVQAAKIIQERVPNFKPKIGIILGSGLSDFTNELENPIFIPYQMLPGFGESIVSGHPGQLALGNLRGVPVACLRGRNHFYEGYDNDVMQTAVRTLKLLGVETLILTNAVGSLRTEVKPGSLVLIYDHINLQFNNPLVGKNDDSFGPRFVPMDDAYDPGLRQQMKETAKHLNIQIHEGIYMGVLGPSYETPAEIRAFQILGADVVGMSTISEVIVARHCGIKVVTISTVTNLATGLSEEKLTHEGVLAAAKKAVHNLTDLICTFVESFKVKDGSTSTHTIA